MSDPRISDAVRATRVTLEVLAQDLKEMRKDNLYMKKLLREIKTSVTRKYEKSAS